MVEIDDILELLDRLINGEVEECEVVKFMNDSSINNNKKIKEALHQAYHFISDKDLRDKDAEYDIICRNDIINYIKILNNLQKL